ncbi:MAG: ADP-ribosylglycohydrolase family protein [Anaerolineae bacterium]|nr:ADP-ribosylglycohydrolase family protein [Anaerolineae bacterium]
MSEKQAQAILYGVALGDALGAPTEFLSLRQIRERFGQEGIQEPPAPALYTDDTQMTLAVTEALILAGVQPVDQIMTEMGAQFVRWLHSPENDRAPGQTCMRGVRRFEEGMPWAEAGLPESKGCGSAMRVAPIGYFFQHRVETLREVAQASSLITHRHPAALAASIGAAYLIKLALDGVAPEQYLGRLYALTEGIAEDYDQALRRVSHVLGWGDEVAAMRYIGEGWVAEEAVALALYCVLRHPDSYVDAARRGANSEGDSDSVACIAGGAAAARLGIESIPQDWIERCEKREYIARTAMQLAASRDRSGEQNGL